MKTGRPKTKIDGAPSEGRTAILHRCLMLMGRAESAYRLANTLDELRDLHDHCTQYLDELREDAAMLSAVEASDTREHLERASSAIVGLYARRLCLLSGDPEDSECV